MLDLRPLDAGSDRDPSVLIGSFGVFCREIGQKARRCQL